MTCKDVSTCDHCSPIYAGGATLTRPLHKNEDSPTTERNGTGTATCECAIETSDACLSALAAAAAAVFLPVGARTTHMPARPPGRCPFCADDRSASLAG